MQHSDFLHPPLLFGRSVKFLQTVLFFTQIFLYAFSQSTTSLQNRGVTGRMAAANGENLRARKKGPTRSGGSYNFLRSHEASPPRGGVALARKFILLAVFHTALQSVYSVVYLFRGAGALRGSENNSFRRENFPRLTCAPQRGVWRKRERGIMHSGASG